MRIKFIMNKASKSLKINKINIDLLLNYQILLNLNKKFSKLLKIIKTSMQ